MAKQRNTKDKRKWGFESYQGLHLFSLHLESKSQYGLFEVEDPQKRVSYELYPLPFDIREAKQIKEIELISVQGKDTRKYTDLIAPFRLRVFKFASKIKALNYLSRIEQRFKD